MITMQRHTKYLQQVDSIINEQIKPSPLYEVDLKQEYNRKEESDNYAENYQPFTTNQGQCVKLSTDLMETLTSHNEEPSRWLPKQDDSPLLKSENNTAELLKRVNEALETHDETSKEKNEERNEEKNVIQELFNKINDILKPDNGRIRGKANKMHTNESNLYHKHSKSHDFFLFRGGELGYPGIIHRSDEKHALLNNNHCRMYENVNSDDDIPRIDYMPVTENSINENIQHDGMTPAYRNSFYGSMCLNNESNTIANLEEQFTGASLEYWGDHSIGSVEHSLTQSEWNILKSPNESINWLQHPFNQSNWLRSNTPSFV